MDFARLPKIGLHLHLDCSLSYAAVSRIDPSITLQEYQQEFQGPKSSFTNLEEFFKRAPKGTALMQTEEQIRIVTFDVFEQLWQDHILYAELLFVPFMHTSQGLSPEHVVAILNDAVAKESSETGSESRIINVRKMHSAFMCIFDNPALDIPSSWSYIARIEQNT